MGGGEHPLATAAPRGHCRFIDYRAPIVDHAFMKILDAYRRWRSRHRDSTSFWLHMLGIPACFLAAPVLAILQYWVLAAAFFVGGYALQFIGHLIEGNRSGEELLIRRIFGREPSDDA
jgi:hypothetical protein